MELNKQEEKARRFQTFKLDILNQLLQTYIEFLTYLLKFLDVRHGYDQQKFVYWTNLKHFTCDTDANTGCDIPDELEAKLDDLFGKIQNVIQSVPNEDVTKIQGQLDKSILYQMFIRSNCEYRSILSRSPIRYGDLLSVQKRLQMDMRREKTMDPIIKRFHDEWLQPQLKLQLNGLKIEDNDTTWDTTSEELHKQLKKTFQSLNTVTNADELERITWLVTRQWNYLFVECDRRLSTPTTTSNDTHQNNENNHGRQH